MDELYYFTSVTANYIPKARVLAKTFKKYNSSKFILALSDNIPYDFDLSAEPFDDIILTDELQSVEYPQSFFFRHNVVEICTAVKPLVALEIMDRFHAKKVCYLDPDIAVFSELVELESLLDKYSMIFTPHTTVPEEADYYIRGNEVLFLKRGTNNLGFFAVRDDEEGRRFLHWWDDRLKLFCLDDDYTLLDLLSEHGLVGLFTDQKWIDMVPSFFDNYLIFKHQGYNVSTWNLSHRVIDENDGNYTVNGQPLRFFHFSGVDFGAHMEVMQRLSIDYPHVKKVIKLSKWYINEEKSAGQIEMANIEWKYARYENGELILKTHRKIMQIRKDIIPDFTNPFYKNEGECYYTWMVGEYRDILGETGNMPLTKPSVSSRFAQWIKRLVMLFVKPDTALYFKLKKIWKAIK